MDDHRFDSLVRRYADASRRDLFRATLAAFAASLWFLVSAPRVRAACLPPGLRCRRSTQCCSGECRKKGRKRRKKCASLPELAFGCTIDDASCGGSATECPDLDNGKCEVDHKGRPVCAVEAAANCTECESNAECIGTLGAGAVCIRCPGCALTGTSCICPFLF